jgi:hypothetical protein
MNDYDPYKCDFNFEEQRAKRMTIEQLQWAIVDCLETIKNGINENKYYDQLSVYRKHLAKKVR